MKKKYKRKKQKTKTPNHNQKKKKNFQKNIPYRFSCNNNSKAIENHILEEVP